MKYKVTNNVEMLNEEFNLEEYNMTNDDYVNDYIDAESEEEAIHTAMDYLSEQIQNNGFDVKVNEEEKEMTVYKDDEPLEKWNNFRAEEQVRDIDIENVDIFFVQNDEFVEMYYNPDATAGGQVVYNTIPYELVHQATEQATNQESVVKDFFEHLDTGCKQYLIDKGTPEFEDACKELIERAGNVQGRTENANIGLNGRWTATMEKIQMTTPLVEMDGDEMTRILWKMIKDELLLPFIDLKTEYYDLGLEHRNETNDQVTVDSANATKKYGVAVKCATITPNAARMTEYNLKEMWKSPNGTIRAMLDGTVFRTPIVVKGIEPCVRNWKKPITIARHAYGDVYKNAEMRIPGPGKAELVYTAEDGTETRELIHNFTGAGVIQGMHNLDNSIESFARSCFEYALSTKQDLWFGGKDTISKTYDGKFKEIFHNIYEAEFKDKFEAADITFFYSLIDDVVARVMKAEGGFIWGCKNYDGDVMSDMISSAFGSLAMMTSVLVSPDGYYEYEAAHGTVQRHYYRHLKGEETSTNSVATIFAWTGALRKRGELDQNQELIEFADKLEKATLSTIEGGQMTKDLALITSLKNVKVLNSREFILAIREKLEAM